MDSNFKLEQEIGSLKSNIQTITIQNQELTMQLDKMVKANEAMREQIDRKEKIQ
jgi:hypothetical protein